MRKKTLLYKPLASLQCFVQNSHATHKKGIRYIAANNSFLLCMKGSYLFLAFIWNTIL